ncbi:MAG: hypothetical protein ACXABG_12725, partial [Promethearchaeota archaeon]
MSVGKEYRRFIIMCFVLLLSIQFVPINSSIYKFYDRDFERASSQDLESSDVPNPPNILRYVALNTD